MKLALIGYGKMGKMVEKASLKRGHTIVAIINSHDSIDSPHIQSADVCIDFTKPESAVNNIRLLAQMGKNIVVGTTGWYDKLDEVKRLIEKSNNACLISPNFSIGVNVFLKLVGEATKLLDPYTEFDIGCLETHHSQKKDSPAGTCFKIAEQILANSKRKTTILYEPLKREKKEHEVHMAALRCGADPGCYSVFFDAPEGTLTLSHQARSREGYAEGALIAAEWLHGKKGFYTFQDII